MTRLFFEHWYREAPATKHKPVMKSAKTLRRHFEYLLNDFECHITNAISKGFNSKIQAVKANACGFRKFLNDRAANLFFCGKLDMSPLLASGH
ncbi:MAG: transposase [Kiritimatiellia bacterium]